MTVNQGRTGSGQPIPARRRTAGDVFVQFVLPAVAAGLLGFAGWYVWTTRPVTRNPPPPIAPATSPYPAALAAAGVVEARTENIEVGSATSGVVVEVLSATRSRIDWVRVERRRGDGDPG